MPRLFAALPVLVATLAPATAAQLYSYDDGSTENALNVAGVAEIGYLHGFVTQGPSDVISAVSAALGTALAPAGGLDGNSLRIAIWDDPTNDGDPTDAVLLYESAPISATQTNSDVKVTYPVSPGIAVAGTFYVGVLTESNAGEFPVGLDISSSVPGALSYLVADTAAIDASNLNAASTPISSSSGSNIFLLDAIGGGSTGLGTIYCTPANVNSTGAAAEIGATGSSNVADNDLTLTMSSLPINSFGFFIGSNQQNFVANPGGSQGNLCLGGQIGRFLQQIQNSGQTGSFSIDVDLTAIPQPNGTVAAMAGQTWNFQGWYRDANPTAVSNFSDAVEITY